jgi:hypothetical protein
MKREPGGGGGKRAKQLNTATTGERTSCKNVEFLFEEQKQEKPGEKKKGKKERRRAFVIYHSAISVGANSVR